MQSRSESERAVVMTMTVRATLALYKLFLLTCLPGSLFLVRLLHNVYYVLYDVVSMLKTQTEASKAPCRHLRDTPQYNTDTIQF